jgi:hypothetical protein
VAHGRGMKGIIDLRNAIIIAAVSGIALAGCSNAPKGVRVTNGGTSAFSAKEGEKIRDLSEGDIKGRIVGKNFQYTREDGNGFVQYNADGTMSITDDVKGELKGRWSVTGQEYCEQRGDAPQECGVFKTTGDAYYAAKSRLVEIQI